MTYVGLKLVSTNPATTAWTATRLGAISGMTIPGDTLKNELLTLNPWKNMRRENVWSDGTATATFGDRCYTDTDVLNMGNVMWNVEKFWYAVDVSLANNYIFLVSDTGADVVRNAADTANITWNVHPLFISNGVTYPRIHLGAYEGFYNTTTSCMESKSAVLGTATTLANGRTYAGNIGAGWGVMTIQARSALQLLMLIHQGNPKMALPNVCDPADSIMGYTWDPAIGVLNGLTNTLAAPCLTGHTAPLGNQCSGVGFTTTTGDGGTAKLTHAPSYFGFENPWGNNETVYDGLTFSGANVYIADNGFSSGSTSSPYTLTGQTAVGSSGNWGACDFSQAAYNWAFIPYSVGGSAGFNGYWQHSTSALLTNMSGYGLGYNYNTMFAGRRGLAASNYVLRLQYMG